MVRPSCLHNTNIPYNYPCFWFIHLAYLMHNHICEVFGWLSKTACTQLTCPQMTAGKRYEFKWADGKEIKRPISIPASDYITNLMIWIEYQFDDPTIFPNYDGAHYSSALFGPVIKDTFRRLIRVYAHILSHHLDYLEESGCKTTFISGLRYFYEFLTRYNLVKEKDFEPVTTNPLWPTYIL